MKTQELYKVIAEKIGALDFETLWPGFHPYRFALYDETEACLDGVVFSRPECFMGNTTVQWQGEQIAIWNVGPDMSGEVVEPDADCLAADMVHEMFHAFQMEQGENRFPDDIEALDYPFLEENYCRKMIENQVLAAAFRCDEIAEKKRLLSRFCSIRAGREVLIGEASAYEFLPETVEGMAEYMGANALRALSMEKYQQKVETYLEILEQSSPMLLDIRRQSYYTGVVMLLTAKTADVDFYHKIREESRPVYRLIEAAARDGESMAVPEGQNEYVKELYAAQKKEREETISRIMSGYRCEAEGSFVIQGYDPMNMWKWENMLYGRHFWRLLDVENQRTIQLTGESLLRVVEGRKVTHYWTMSA